MLGHGASPPTKFGVKYCCTAERMVAILTVKSEIGYYLGAVSATWQETRQWPLHVLYCMYSLKLFRGPLKSYMSSTVALHVVTYRKKVDSHAVSFYGAFESHRKLGILKLYTIVDGRFMTLTYNAYIISVLSRWWVRFGERAGRNESQFPPLKVDICVSACVEPYLRYVSSTTARGNEAR